MAKLTSDLQDLRKKDVKALESLVLEIRENQFFKFIEFYSNYWKRIESESSFQ